VTRITKLLVEAVGGTGPFSNNQKPIDPVLSLLACLLPPAFSDIERAIRSHLFAIAGF